MNAVAAKVQELARTNEALSKLDKLAGLRIVDGRVDLTPWAEPPEEAQFIHPLAYWEDAVIRKFRQTEPEGSKLPWAKLAQNARIRPAEVTIWAGGNGTGKSLLTGAVLMSLAQQRERVLLASLEMSPLATIYRLARQGLGRNPTDDEVRVYFSAVTDLFLVFDQQQTVRWQTMLALGRYAAAELGVRHLCIDSHTKCGFRKDDYDSQIMFVDKLTALAKETGLHIHLVMHMRKAENEYYRSDKMDVRGPGELTDLADNVWTLWRNKRKEAELEKTHPDDKYRDEPDAVLACTKQRHGEWEGNLRLWYDRERMLYCDSQGGAEGGY